MRALVGGVVFASMLCWGVLVRAADTAELIQAISSGELAARVQAIDHLAQLGPKAAEAVPKLTELLADEAPAVRSHAARALGMIGEAAQPAVPKLVKLVADRNQLVRREAVMALGKIKPGPKIGVPLMARLLRDADPAVRVRAMSALADQGKAAVPFLTKALEDEDTCYWACLVLADIGPDAAEAVPALAKCIAHEKPEVAREAVLALGKIGPAAKEAVPALAEALDSKQPGVALAAAFALGAIGPDAKPAAGKLERMAKSEEDLAETVGTWALARISPDDKKLRSKAVALLAEHLKAEKKAVREAAARALAELHPAPGEFAPYIQKALAGQSEETIARALDALAALGPAAVPGLVQGLAVKDSQAAIAYILGQIGPEAKEAVPALTGVLASDNPRARREAAMALGKIGAASKPAVPALVKLLADADEKVQAGALFALGHIGPDAIEAKAELTKLLHGDDEFLKLGAAWALAHVDPACKETSPKSVPLLIKAMEDPKPLVRLEAARALKCLGPAAKDAAAALKKAAREDKEEYVREMAAEALKAVE